MSFASLLPALLAVLPVLTSARALPATTSTTDYPQFCMGSGPPPYNGYFCDWISDLTYTNAFQCSCNFPASPSDYDLAHFFSRVNYGGFEYNGYGQYETCYDLEFIYWNKVAASMSLGKEASSCWVWNQPGCLGQPDTELDSNVAKFSYPSGSGVASFKCYGPVAPPLPPPQSTPQYLPPTTPTPTYLSTSRSPKLSSSKDGVFGTPTPVYAPPSPPPISPGSKDGGNSTPTPTLSTSIYVPPPPAPLKSTSYPLPPPPISPTVPLLPPPKSTSSKDSGIVISTPIPTASTPVYVLPPPPAISTSHPVLPTVSSSSQDSGNGTLPSTPTASSIYASLLTPIQPSSSSSSKYGADLTTPPPIPTPTPIYVPPPPPPPSHPTITPSSLYYDYP